jgi:hypothetical protein
MIWLLLVACSLAFVELFLLLNVAARVGRFLELGEKIKWLVGSKVIADHWKEKILPIYAGRLFTNSIGFLACLFLCFSPFIIFLLPFFPTASSLQEILLSWKGVLISSIAAITYAKLRASTGSSHNYGALSRLFHRLALGNNLVPEISFDIERSFSGRGLNDRSSEPHVFVSGLARAGTTALMRTLYQTGEFRSLTYRDMPFVLAPNLWRNISGKAKREAESQERAHGDGIRIDFDSPEALDEVFWRVHYGDQYILEDSLAEKRPEPEVLDAYKDYVNLALKGTEKRYLCKNNNNILRIPSLLEALPNSFVLIPFREPTSHAESLRRQHELFCGEQEKDRFTLNYMNWLSHHEFGLGRRPFVFKGEELPKGNPGELDYWLQQWLKVYRNLLPLCGGNVVPVAYEDLAGEDASVWQRLFELLHLGPAPSENPMHRPRRYDVKSANNKLAEEANFIYDQLRERSPIGSRLNGKI